MDIAASLSAPLAARLEAALDPGEEVIWVGQPRPGVMIRPTYVLVPFGLGLTGLATLIGTSLVINAPAHWLGFVCLGAPFIVLALAGLALRYSPFWVRGCAKQTLYVLTNRRALIMEPSRFGGLMTSSFSPVGLGHMTIREYRDGSGDLLL
jgi:hypothetical protein